MSSKTFNLTLHEYANGRMFFNEIRRYYEFLFMSGHDCMRKCGPTTENSYAVLVFFSNYPTSELQRALLRIPTGALKGQFSFK